MSGPPIKYGSEEIKADKKSTIILLIITHAILIIGAIFYIQPSAEKTIAEHELELRNLLDSMTCEELWVYHTELFCNPRFGCTHNDEYQWAGMVYQSRCK